MSGSLKIEKRTKVALAALVATFFSLLIPLGGAVAATEAQCRAEWDTVNKKSKTALAAFLRPCGKSSKATEAKNLLARLNRPIPPNIIPPNRNQTTPEQVSNVQVCRGYTVRWESAVWGNDTLQIARERGAAESVRSLCPELLRRIDLYYPDDAVHRLAKFLLDKNFTPNRQIASDSEGIVNGGFDIVEFFESKSTPRSLKQGLFEYSAIHLGGIYLFINIENRDKFAKNPYTYLPQFGGYCAECLAQKHIVAGRWESADVFGGKIYVLSNENLLDFWIKNRTSRLSVAQSVWNTTNWSAQKPAWTDVELTNSLKLALRDVNRSVADAAR